MRPSPRRGLVPEAVGLAHVRDLRHQRVVRVWVRQQRADGEQHLGDGQRRAPLVLEDVQADVAVAVDVRVEHLRLEHHLFCLLFSGSLSYDLAWHSAIFFIFIFFSHGLRDEEEHASKYLGGLERVIWREVDDDQEHSSRVGAVARAHDRRLPVEHVIRHGP